MRSPPQSGAAIGTFESIAAAPYAVRDDDGSIADASINDIFTRTARWRARQCASRIKSSYIK
ncbi:hypothetical protein FCE95_13250 [Luteimonas gilva]|uniref:Uncharacterized protein n=1 Tax=Luteimonas gilva TaxID=2572684 RepID=A0A4U5JMV3_9GAMM|nr:hypothetical protein [Luteimonas gilva]TKR31030.1 hypothetical protein FCE95_13250 [Luteimonas gilva]